jgi:Tfp pilus assembly protein PilV
MRETRPGTSGERAEERGSSLIEVMVALMIMLFLMIGVLQLFTMAYLVNLGAGARTEMASKAAQVVENMRYLQYLTKATPKGLGQSPPGTTTTIGIAFPITSAASGTLDPTTNTYWGPTGANVFPTTSTNATPYQISYTIVDATTWWRVTVTVQSSTVSGARKYLGEGITRKRVDYVAQVPK